MLWTVLVQAEGASKPLEHLELADFADNTYDSGNMVHRCNLRSRFLG